MRYTTIRDCIIVTEKIYSILMIPDYQYVRMGPEGQAAAADRKILAPDADDSQMYLFDSREV